MIFVTVGTHEQAFNRLVETVDYLVAEGVIVEDVVMQIGYSTYIPKHCRWHKLIPYEDMENYIKKARIVITHGGPSSFLMSLQYGKVPIVVPRMKKLKEHINDHQIEFCTQVAEKLKNIILVLEIGELAAKIMNYEQVVESIRPNMVNNNEMFLIRFEEEANKLFN